MRRCLEKQIERLYSTAVSEENPEGIVPEIPAIFADVASVDMAALFKVSEDRLKRSATYVENGSPLLTETFPLEPNWLSKPHDDPGPFEVMASTDSAIARAAFDVWHAQSVSLIVLGDHKGLLGVVLLASSERRDFSDEQREFLRLLARSATSQMRQQTTYEAMRTAVRSREQILAVVAHELRNPISVIIMGAQGVLNRVPDSASRRSIDRIVSAAQRADRLIQDLLEISAIDEGRFTVDLRLLDITDVVLAGLESQQAHAAAASIIIAPDISPELPLVMGDEIRLLEILENLIVNAIKFTPVGGRIDVTASRRHKELLIGVRDTGQGITPENLPHLFDRYWQAKQADRRGSGLGLTICKAIVEAHGGRIWANSVQGIGTDIQFTIPIPPTSVTPNRTAIETVNILLVDDRPENLLSLTAILEQPEYRLVCARSGAEALSLTLRTRFSVILLDVAMPGMNGLEVATYLKELERSRDIPIIFITAYGDDPEEVHRAYAAGGADYLVKPLDPDIVRKKVAVFVALSRRRQVRMVHPVMGDTSIQGAANGISSVG